MTSTPNLAAMIESAERAYNTGNFAAARAQLEVLVAEAESDDGANAGEIPADLRARAQTLATKTSADPMAGYLFAACVGFFVLVAVSYLL